MNIKLLQFYIAHDRLTTAWDDSEYASIFWNYSTKGQVMKSESTYKKMRKIHVLVKVM